MAAVRVSALRQGGPHVSRLTAYIVRHPDCLLLVVGAALVGFTLGMTVSASLPGIPCHP
jgi:hypothetical protein